VRGVIAVALVVAELAARRIAAHQPSATTLAAGSASNLNSGTLLAARMPALTGDVTTSAGAIATTLATVNSNVGSFGDSTHVGAFTVNGKGLVTAASSVALAPTFASLTGTATYAQLPTEVQQVPLGFVLPGRPASGQVYNLSVPFAVTIPASLAGAAHPGQDFVGHGDPRHFVGQDLRVAHRGVEVRIDEAQLQLDPGHPQFTIKKLGLEHLREYVQTATDLPPVGPKVVVREGAKRRPFMSTQHGPPLPIARR